MNKISERQARLWCLVLVAFTGLVAGGEVLISSNPIVGVIGVGTGVMLGLLALLYWRGWEPARLLALVLFTIATIGALDSDQVIGAVAIASTFALLLADPWWIVGIGLLTLVGIIVRGALFAVSGGTITPGDLPVIVMLVGIMALTRFVLEAERRKGHELAAHADEARVQSAAQAAELAVQTERLTRQNEEQGRLLELVATLETPTVTIGDGVLLAPVIGHVDSRRAGSLTSRLLAMVSQQRSRLVVLDLSGVPTVDTAVAKSLMGTVRAVQLLGCAVALTGIAASVAATMAQLGLDFAGVKIWRSPQEALAALVEEA